MYLQQLQFHSEVEPLKLQAAGWSAGVLPARPDDNSGCCGLPSKSPDKGKCAEFYHGLHLSECGFLPKRKNTFLLF